MVHKSNIIPGLSRFIDDNILSHYPPTSMKRILMAGAVSLYLKQNEGLIDSITSNPLLKGLGVAREDGMIDIESLRDTLKKEIEKAGYMRVSIPVVGDIDFTTEDVDSLYKCISEYSNTPKLSLTPTQHQITNNGGVY